MCEINPFCNKVLHSHWPSMHYETDINTIDANKLPLAEVWCGGFPCQDISLARGKSKRLGLYGSRSGLFYRYADLIRQRRPEVVVLENVGGLFTSNGGRDFGLILQTLTRMGYGVAWRLLNSRYFGVPQSRTRVYICCWRNAPQKALSVMFDAEGAQKPDSERCDFLALDGAADRFPKVPKVSYCLAASSGRHTGTDWSRTYVVCGNGVRRLSPLESERLQGFPDNWSLPEGTAETENVDTLRYTAIGNAVSVPVVEWVAGKIRDVLDKGEQCYCEPILASYKDLRGREWNPSLLSEIDFSDIAVHHCWQNSGLAWNDRFIECKVHPTPALIRRTTLLPLIETEQNKSHYFLTPNAADGILRRVDKQNRTLFIPLREALEQLRALNVR